MALTGTDRGQSAASTATSLYNLLPASNFTAGALAVLCVSGDNSASSGSSNNIDSVTDSLGNTWTKRLSALYDPGAANAGIQGAIFTTPQTAGALTTTSTIQISFGANTTAKSYTLMEVTAASGYFAAYRTGGTNTGSATNAPTVTTDSITNGEMVIGALFNEYGTAQTVTGDADTTDGSWSTQQTAEIGSTTSGNTISSQRKVVTATGTQTYNPTLGTSSDVILGWIAVGEYSNVSGSSATTNANDTGTATATETFTGTSATTNANDTGTATATETFTGTSATTNANDTSTASGSVEAASITGTSATTNANDAGTATATETFTGTSATTNANDTSTANGVMAIVGSSATTNANDITGGAGGALPDTPTLHLDFSDTGTLTLSGAFISQVDDQSGNGYNFTQTADDNRPTSEVDGVLGQAATFTADGSTDDFMESTATVANLTNASAWTIAARIRVASITSGLASTYGDGILFPFGVAGPSIHLRSDGAGDDRAYASNEDGGWPPDECYVAIDLDTELILIAKFEGGTLSIQIGNGTPATTTSGNVTATTQTWQLGYAAGGGNWFDGAMSHVAAWDRALDSGEISDLVSYLSGTGGGGAAGIVANVGSSAPTNANDTDSASGTVVNPVTGTSTTTNANDTSSATATETFTGTSTTTNANDAGTATGSVSSDTVTGTSATTNANDAGTATATEAFTGTSATTNANDTGTATGAVANPVTGTSATTNANDSGTATATEAFTGTSATTNAHDTGTATATEAFTGTSATTNANDSGTATATEAFTGTSATTNANDASTATATETFTGTSATTNANDTSTAAGTVTATETFTGTSATTNANDTSSATGAVANPVTGTSATTNANDTSTATGTVTAAGAVEGTSATTNADDSGTATATETFTGTSATTNADDTASATGVVTNPVTGTSATTNANDTSTATATEAFTGTSATTNADDTSTATATEAFTGTSATTNANDAGTATATESFTGTSATTNANDSDTATGQVDNPITGTSATTNANDSGTATATEAVIGTSATTNANDTSIANDFLPGGPNVGVVVPARVTSVEAGPRDLGVVVPARRTAIIL